MRVASDNEVQLWHRPCQFLTRFALVKKVKVKIELKLLATVQQKYGGLTTES